MPKNFCTSFSHAYAANRWEGIHVFFTPTWQAHRWKRPEFFVTDQCLQLLHNQRIRIKFSVTKACICFVSKQNFKIHDVCALVVLSCKMRSERHNEWPIRNNLKELSTIYQNRKNNLMYFLACIITFEMKIKRMLNRTLPANQVLFAVWTNNTSLTWFVFDPHAV